MYAKQNRNVTMFNKINKDLNLHDKPLPDLNFILYINDVVDYCLLV